MVVAHEPTVGHVVADHGHVVALCGADQAENG